MPITKLDQMLEALRNKPKKRLVAAAANDEHTIEAVKAAVDAGIVEGILVGDETKIKEICKKDGIDPGIFKIISEPAELKAASRAVAMVRAGEGDILMKGSLSTDKYMRALLNKEQGLLEPGAILSHVTVVENPRYHKLLIVGDVAVIPAPELKEKTAILNYLLNTAKALQIETPKVAL